MHTGAEPPVPPHSLFGGGTENGKWLRPAFAPGAFFQAKRDECRMKVCVFRVGWQPFIELPLSNLAEVLHERGHDVTIVKSLARTDLGMGEEAHPAAKCIFIGLFFKRVAKIRGLTMIARLLGWVEYVLRCAWHGLRERADIYVAIDVDAFPAAWICARLRGKKCVLYAYELYADRPGISPRRLWLWLEKTLTRHADLVVACEKNRARIMMERSGLSEMPVVVQNVSRRSEAPPKSTRIPDLLAARGIHDARVAYYHGWINRGRCADSFVEAMLGLPENVVLFFVGPREAAFEAALTQRAQELGVGHRVIFHGMVPSSELLEWTASAHVGLQVQRNAGLNSYYCAPIKVFQYFAAGLPVLAPNFPGMVDLVEGERLGLCVDPESVEDIREGMRRLLLDDAFREECARNALGVSRGRYCYEEESRAFIAAIETLGGGR